MANKKVKENGMLNLGGINMLTKKIKRQNPKDKLGGPLPFEGTGIDVITGTCYGKNPKKKNKKKVK